MGGDDFNKTDEAKPHVEWADEGTLLSKLNNQYEFSKIRHDAAEKYFEELCNTIEKMIKIQHSYRTYFLYISIEFPPNLSTFVARPESEGNDFLMQKNWCDKFETYMKKNQINCQKIDKSDYGSNGELNLTIKHSSRKSRKTYEDGRKYTFDYDSLKLRDNMMIKSDEFTIAGATEIGLEDIIDTFVGISWTKRVVDNKESSYNFLQKSDGHHGFSIDFEFDHTNRSKQNLSIRLQKNFSLRIKSYPSGYFSGLTLSEREKTRTNTEEFLLTWPKYVYVDSKEWENDCEIEEEEEEWYE